MSSFSQITKHPVTGVYEKAEYIDDYFMPHVYGVKFPSDEKVYPLELVDRAQIKTYWASDVIAALAYLEGFNAEKGVLTFLNQLEKEYKARWKRDPEGGEGAIDYYMDHVI